MSAVTMNRLGPSEMDIQLAAGQRIYIIGQCYIHVVKGTVDMMGFRMEEHMPRLYICSPKSLSLMGVTGVGVDAVIKLKSVDNNLFEIEKMQSAFQDMVTFSREKTEDIRGCWVITTPYDDIRFFEPGARWDPIASEVAPIQHPIVFICGNRKVGKSTFSRYLVNRMLNYHPQVAYFDFDCGQAEFTPSGFVAYSVRESPFTAPNFVNLSTSPHGCRFYASSTPSDDPRHYLDCCLDLWNSHKNECSGMPVVINMLGWVSGLGLALHSHLLHNLRPTHVLAFGEDPPAGEDYVSKAMYTKSGFPGDMPLDGKLLPAIAYIPTVSSISTVKISPMDSRSLSLWCYFYHNHSLCRYDFGTPLYKKQPFMISTNALCIHFQMPVPKGGFWPSLNCRLVGLASDDNSQIGMATYSQKRIIRKVFGLGFVRGVDPKNKLVFIVTPLPVESLSLCNTLMVSNLQFPPALLTHGHQFDGPYLSFMANFDSTGSNPRKVRHNIIRTRQ